MKRLYLSSEIEYVAKSIAVDIGEAKSKKLAFINTAYEYKTPESDWIKRDREGLINAGFEVFDYTISGKTRKDFEEKLGDADIIHVNGGNSFYLLLQSRRSGFDKWIKKEVERGKIYTSSSAGSSVAAPDIEVKRKKESEPYIGKLGNFKAFGLVDFIIMPHWGRGDMKSLYTGQRFDLAYSEDKNKLLYINDY